jgi:hypothetical protein
MGIKPRHKGRSGLVGVQAPSNPPPCSLPYKGRYFVFGHFLTISADA